MLGLEAAGLGAQLHDRDARGIVDEQRRRRETVCRIDQLGPVLVLELAYAQALRVNGPLGTEHALHELLLRHFQGKERDRLVFPHGHIGSDVQRERCLAHTRTSRDQDEVRRLEARGQPVEVDEAGGQARQRPFIDGMLFDLTEGLEQDVLQRHKGAAVLPRCHLEDALLRLVHDIGDIL